MEMSGRVERTRPAEHVQTLALLFRPCIHGSHISLPPDVLSRPISRLVQLRIPLGAETQRLPWAFAARRKLDRNQKHPGPQQSRQVTPLCSTSILRPEIQSTRQFRPLQLRYIARSCPAAEAPRSRRHRQSLAAQWQAPCDAAFPQRRGLSRTMLPSARTAQQCFRLPTPM